MKKSTKIIIGIIVGVVILMLVSCIGFGFYFLKILENKIDNGIENIIENVDDYNGQEQAREDIYDSITEELLNKKLISNGWKYVSYDYEWDTVFPDRTNKYYFYIDSEKYEPYKSYWLEGVDENLYYDGYNANLSRNGDYVFHVVNINDLTYESDIEYSNIHLSANKTYYLVQIYDEAIYYEYVWSYEDSDEFFIDSASDYNLDSLSKEYIFYQENGQWIVKELVR